MPGTNGKTNGISDPVINPSARIPVTDRTKSAPKAQVIPIGRGRGLARLSLCEILSSIHHVWKRPVTKNRKKRKHVPQRTCVGCRTVQPKRSMIRLVRTGEGIQPDPGGKIPGRGAYLHELRSCWEKGLKGALAHALKTELSPQDLERLSVLMAALPEETSLPGESDA